MSPRWWHRSRSFFSVCPVSLAYHRLWLPPETIANARRDAIAIKTISAQHQFRGHSPFLVAITYKNPRVIALDCPGRITGQARSRFSGHNAEPVEQEQG